MLINHEEQYSLAGDIDVPGGWNETGESDDALDRITVLADELPRRIRSTLNEFRRERMSGLLSGIGSDRLQHRPPCPG